VKKSSSYPAQEVFITEKLNKYDPVTYLNSNSPESPSYLAVGKADELIADTNGFESLEAFWEKHHDWMFGYLSYDLKNEVEKLKSENPDRLKFPLLHFYRPAILLIFREGETEAHFDDEHTSETEVKELLQLLNNSEEEQKHGPVDLRPRITKAEYLQATARLQEHMQKGDVYEVNFCQEFFAEGASINPYGLYRQLNTLSPTPFSCFYRNDDKYLLCASPERFLKKEGSRLTSQPIKGTAPRHPDAAKDEELKRTLLASAKEQQENIMIVDLVRNDLSRSATKASVQVDELFGLYSFPQVHQLISTVSCELKNDIHFVDAIKNAFPMGSMTGAPKISAMQLIERYESHKRGLFSGAVGHITPDGDFDFNVVIRSLLYNASEHYLSCSVGGAITAKSDLEEEYAECLLKAKVIFEILGKPTPELAG